MSDDVEQQQHNGIAVSTVAAGNGMVVRVAGIVDMLTARTLVEHLDQALARGPSTLIIDLTEVEFLASAGITALINAHRIAGRACTVAVVAANYATSRPITLTKADREVTLCASMRDALTLLDRAAS